MKLKHLIVPLAVASVTVAAPIKRGLLDELFGLDSTTTTSAVAVAAAPVAAVATTSTPAVASATSSAGGFWANLFGSFGSTTTAATAPIAAATTPAATTPVAAAAASTTTPSSTSSSSGGFFSNLLKDLFGTSSGSTTEEAASVATTTTAAAAATAATAAAQTASTPSSSSSSSSSGYTGESLWEYLFGGSGSSSSSSSSSQVAVGASSAPTAATALVSSPSVATAGLTASSLVTSFSSVITNTYQGGSPGKYTGSINTETATALNGGSSAGATAAVGALGITYSPYTKSDQCKTSSEVASDIALLSNYELIRLYSTDCSGIENVLAAMSSNQKLYLGLWNIDTQSVQNGLQEIKTAIATSSRGWSAVHTIAVGNERVNAGAATVDQMQTAVDTARTWLKSNAAAYTGYVVTVDTLVAYVGNPQLCEMSDYLAVNSHPYWDGGVQPSNSGPWLLQQISNLQNVCGTSKEVLITETGWPTQGDSYGSCVPSVPNQVAALKSIVSSLGSKAIVFTMYNDYWKDPGAYNVEQHWGIFGDPSV